MALEPETPLEQSDKHYLVFDHIETMDTQQARVGLDDRRAAWVENLQIIGHNDLVTVPGPIAALQTLTGETVVRIYYATFAGVLAGAVAADYIVAFCLSGSAYTINLNGGALIKFANAGTFSGASDCTQWKSERILIADPTSGYATWDGTVFVQQGGVSPNIAVTNGGSGYITPPGVTIGGGTGGGATAHAVIIGGVVTQVILDTAGAGYKAGDVLTVTFSSGAATATAVVWPFLTVVPVSLAVYQGRVWLVGGRVLQWTGTGRAFASGGYDDSASANAAGLQIFSDSDLVHSFTCIRALNNYLYLFGDNSVKQIGTIQVVASVTQFVPTTLTSDQGTTFPQSVIAYNRLVVFANKVGIWAIFGASVEKLSGPMDGIFQNLDFTQPIIAATNDLRNIRTLLMLAKYNDPLLGTRAIFMSYFDKKWFVVTQGTSIRAACQAPVGGVMQTFVSSGADITQILASLTVPVAWLLRTALSDSKKSWLGKRQIRIGVAHTAQTQTTVTLTTDSENGNTSQSYSVAFPVIWLNAVNAVVNWINSLSQVVTFVGAGFLFRCSQANASGIYLGASIAGTSYGFHVHGIVIEWQDATAMRSKNK